MFVDGVNISKDIRYALETLTSLGFTMFIYFITWEDTEEYFRDDFMTIYGVNNCEYDEIIEELVKEGYLWEDNDTWYFFYNNRVQKKEVKPY